MKLKDEPAYPITEDAINYRNRDFSMQGFTKLEEYAKAAMQALLSVREYGPSEPERFAKWAFDMAEAMCAEAERRRAEAMKKG